MRAVYGCQVTGAASALHSYQQWPTICLLEQNDIQLVSASSEGNAMQPGR